MRVEPEDGHEIVLFAGQKGKPMFAVESHAVVALTFAHWVFSDLFVSRWVNFGDHVLILEIYKNVFGNGIKAGIARLAAKMKRCYDLILGYIHHGFGFRAFVGDIDLVERRRV